MIVKHLRKVLVYHKTERDWGLGLEEVAGVCFESSWCFAFCARRALDGSMPQLLSVLKSLHAQQYLLGPLRPCAPWAGVVVPIQLAGSAEKQGTHKMAPQATETLIDVRGIRYS